MSRVRVPGKAMMAGEYAVLLPGEPCLVASLDRYLEARVSEAPRWSLSSAEARWAEGEAVPESLSFAVEALEEVRRRWPGLPARAIETVDGLKDAQGRKLGLGGSAAATVAVTWAAALGTGASREELWRLADEVHRRVQGGRGSGADVAASVFGGVNRFVRSPLGARPVKPHPELRVLLAWSGSSFRTSSRLSSFDSFARENPGKAAAFAAASRRAVEDLEAALEQGEARSIAESVAEARTALLQLEKAWGGEIETPALARAAEVAGRFGAAGKLSGAGGGDCALILAVGDEVRARVAEGLREAGLEPVFVSLAGGVDVVES